MDERLASRRGRTPRAPRATDTAKTPAAEEASHGARAKQERGSQ